MPNIPNTGAPAFADYMFADNSISLNTLKPGNTLLCWMFTRYLLQKTISVFKWNLPEHWDNIYFLYVLYCFGRVAIINTDRFGVIPQACGLMGYNVFYRPTNAIITNPLLTGIIQPRIGIETTLLSLEPDYGGIMDIVTHYANLLAQASEAAAVNLNNSKVAYAFFLDASNGKARAETFYKAFDAVSNGQPAVVIDKNLVNEDGSPAWGLFTQDVKSNYILSDIIRDMRKIESDFDTRIGIPNANTDKPERLITDEVNANNVETSITCAGWLERLKKDCEKANRMFGLSLSVDWRYPPQLLRNGGVYNGTVPKETDAE